MRDVAGLRRSLLRWFSRSKRALPWRRTRDAYAIWISETMLQQTTVGTVVPYYERFMARFPNAASLASADEDEVLALWSGLGYYSRARNLRHAARQILEMPGGRFPRDAEAAMALKGVGRYTANAVTSMAYGAPNAVVDGNVRRVLARLYATPLRGDSEAQEKANALLSTRSPGHWNEALMELGALVCTPRGPRCDACPVAAHCRGRDRPEHWSEGKPRRAGVPTIVEMALVERGGRVLLERNRDGGLLGGLYELPHGGLPGRSGVSISLRERCRETLRIEPEAVATFRHAITHHRIEARVFGARLQGSKAPDGAAFHSIADVASLPLGGLTRKALRAAGLLGG